MRLSVKHDISIACKTIIKEKLGQMGLDYVSVSLGEVELTDDVTKEQLNYLNESLRNYGIEIVDSHRNTFIQKIKDIIAEMIHSEENMPPIKISAYIAEKANYSYSHIASIFSEATFMTIENYIILQKVERAKQLILEQDLSLTETAYRLNYSSVAHLSNQFKKTTGLTPSAFQAIIRKRRSIKSS